MKAVYLDDAIHRRLKLVAARQGRPLKAVVQSLLGHALDEDRGSTAVTTPEMQTLAARGGGFAFWDHDGEDIYTLSDGEPVE